MDEYEPNRCGRRGFLTAAVSVTSAAGLLGRSRPASAAPVDAAVGHVRFGAHTLRVVDLTHKLTRQFNFDPAHPRISFESVDGSGVAVGMKMHRLSLIEHVGTHMDAPSHFGESLSSLGQIPIQDLVVPLAIVDLTEKFAQSTDAQLEPADIERWEMRHGPLPDGCCVAMDTGYDLLTLTARPPTSRRLQMPGFSVEAARMLAEKRRVKGIAVDSGTIDAGPNVPSYPVHQYWLRSGRWGIEGITNLKAVPAVGALLIVGAPPVENATGMPIRAIALF